MQITAASPAMRRPFCARVPFQAVDIAPTSRNFPTFVSRLVRDIQQTSEWRASYQGSWAVIPPKQAPSKRIYMEDCHFFMNPKGEKVLQAGSYTFRSPLRDFASLSGTTQDGKGFKIDLSTNGQNRWYRCFLKSSNPSTTNHKTTREHFIWRSIKALSKPTSTFVTLHTQQEDSTTYNTLYNLFSGLKTKLIQSPQPV
jgi:hypothetical protein